jgi:hypothetical protein
MAWFCGLLLAMLPRPHQDRLPVVLTMASGDGGFLGVWARQGNAALILAGLLGPVGSRLRGVA